MESQISSISVIVAIIVVFIAAALFRGWWAATERNAELQNDNHQLRLRLAMQNQIMQQQAQGLGLPAIVVIAGVVIVAILFVSAVLQPSSAATSNTDTKPLPTMAAQPFQPTPELVGMSPLQTNEQMLGLKTLNEFIFWRANALRTKNWNGMERFLTDDARTQMISSIAQLETENCFWEQQALPATFVGVRDIRTESFQMSVSFDIQGQLYCDGQHDPRSVLNPTRVGATINFVKVGGRWLISNSSAIRELTGTIAPPER